MKKFPFAGLLLIIVGVYLLLRNVIDIDIRFWDFFVPVALILWGVSMLVKNISRSQKKLP